jgi:hypothetical protein
MSSASNAEFRKVGMIGATIGIGSAGMLLLMEKHPRFALVWLCVLGAASVYVLAQLLRIRKSRAGSK